MIHYSSAVPRFDPPAPLCVIQSDSLVSEKHGEVEPGSGASAQRLRAVRANGDAISGPHASERVGASLGTLESGRVILPCGSLTGVWVVLRPLPTASWASSKLSN